MVQEATTSKEEMDAMREEKDTPIEETQEETEEETTEETTEETPKEENPGRTVIRSAPIVSIFEMISASAPLPTDMRIITAATPITIPNIVKKLRSLCVIMPTHAEDNGSNNFFMLFPPPLSVHPLCE